MIIGAVVGLVALSILSFFVTTLQGYEFRPYTYSWFLWGGVGALIGYFFS